MGLDIHLHKVEEDPDQMKSNEEAFEQERADLINEAIRKAGVSSWSELPGGIQEELNAREDKLQDKYNLEGAMSHGWGDVIEHPSSQYPDHLFKIGYWRSSYNESGINHILHQIMNKTLEDLLPEGSGGKWRIVDWSDVHERALDLREEFQRRVEEVGPYGITKISYNPFSDFRESEITSPYKALKRFEKERERDINSNQYRNKYGSFFTGEPIEVHAIIEGKEETFAGHEQPAFFTVYKKEADGLGESGYDWYIKALDIVVETIEWILDQDNPSEYVLSWST